MVNFKLVFLASGLCSSNFLHQESFSVIQVHLEVHLPGLYWLCACVRWRLYLWAGALCVHLVLFKWHTDSITGSIFACAIPWEGSFCKSPISATTFVICSWDVCIAIFGNVMLMSRSKTETVFQGCLTPGQLTLILAMPHFGLDVIYVQIALNDSKTRSLGTNRWLL